MKANTHKAAHSPSHRRLTFTLAAIRETCCLLYIERSSAIMHAGGYVHPQVAAISYRNPLRIAHIGQSRGLFSFVFNASAPSGCGLMHRYTGMCDIRGVKSIPLYGVNLLCLTLDAVHKFFRRLRVTTNLCTASAILNFVRGGNTFPILIRNLRQRSARAIIRAMARSRSSPAAAVSGPSRAKSWLEASAQNERGQ